MGGRGSGGAGKAGGRGGGGGGGVLTVDQSIEAVYNRLVNRPGDWASIADIRDELAHRVPRDQIDAALRRLEQRPGVNIVPESNQKTLTDRQRRGAIIIGDQPKHLITFH